MLKESIVVLIVISGYCKANGYYGGNDFDFGFGDELSEAYNALGSYGATHEPSYGSYGSSYGALFGPSYGIHGSRIDPHGFYRPIKAPNKRRRYVRPYLPRKRIYPKIIKVHAEEVPVKVVYLTKSSDVDVRQFHKKGAPGKFTSTKTLEEPHRLYHQVVRPVIQEIHEVIVPYRKVVQRIEPVIEEIQTIVAKGEPSYGSQPLPETVGQKLDAGVDLGKGLTLGGAYSGAYSGAAKSS